MFALNSTSSRAIPIKSRKTAQEYLKINQQRMAVYLLTPRIQPFSTDCLKYKLVPIYLFFYLLIYSSVTVTVTAISLRMYEIGAMFYIYKSIE